MCIIIQIHCISTPFLLFDCFYYTMIRTLYQEDNGRDSSLTLEVGVFLLEEDKFYSLTQKIPPPRERRDFDMFSF